MRLPASVRSLPPPAVSRPSRAPTTSASLWPAPLSRRKRPGALCLGGGSPRGRSAGASLPRCVSPFGK
eukprot:5150540-Alexandrium_andersonii.AAC.1